jgi:hypothetical protein
MSVKILGKARAGIEFWNGYLMFQGIELMRFGESEADILFGW